MNAIFYLNEKGYTKSIDFTETNIRVVIPERHLIVGLILYDRFAAPYTTPSSTNSDFNLFATLRTTGILKLKPIEMLLMTTSNLTIRFAPNEYRQANEFYEFFKLDYPFV